MPQIDFTLIGLPNFMKPNRVSDEEALLLYKTWSDSPPGSDIIAEASKVRGLVNKGLLKSRGMQEGMGSRFALTSDGRAILIEMVTNLPSSLKEDAKPPAYSDIKSRRARSGKQTFLKKAERDTPGVVVRIEGFDAP